MSYEYKTAIIQMALGEDVPPDIDALHNFAREIAAYTYGPENIDPLIDAPLKLTGELNQWDEAIERVLLALTGGISIRFSNTSKCSLFKRRFSAFRA